MRKKQRSIIAEDKDGKLYVLQSSFVSPLAAMVDGLPMVFFGREKVAYTLIDTAIEWCEKEARESGDEVYSKIATHLQRIKQDQADGELKYTDEGK